jgi:hypothetical protein
MANKTSMNQTPDGRAFYLLLAALQNRPYVKVGVLQSRYNDPVDTPLGTQALGDWAVANEFGTSQVAESSFIRSTVDTQSSGAWPSLAEGIRQDLLAGRRTLEESLQVMGARVQQDIQASAQMTGSTPLVDGIDYEVHLEDDL